MMIFLDQSKEANEWDYEISVSGFTPISTKNDWLNYRDYIEDVTYAIRLPLNLSKKDSEDEAFLFAASDLSKSFNIGIEFVEKNGIYISEYHSQKLNLSESDWIEVKIPVLQKDSSFDTKIFTMEILGIHSNPMGLYVYADIDYIFKMININDYANVFSPR